MEFCSYCNTKYEIKPNHLHNLTRHELACGRKLHVVISTTVCPHCGALNVRFVRILRNKTKANSDRITDALEKAKSVDDFDVILKGFAK